MGNLAIRALDNSGIGFNEVSISDEGGRKRGAYKRTFEAIANFFPSDVTTTQYRDQSRQV